MNHFKDKIIDAACRYPHRLSRIWLERSASAAVEFAIALPVLLALMVGAAELSQVYIAERKLLRATNIVGDIMVREPVADRDQMDRLFTGAEAILGPSFADDLEMRVTAVEWQGSTDMPGERLGLTNPSHGLGNNGTNPDAGNANGNQPSSNRARTAEDGQMVVAWSHARGTTPDIAGQPFNFEDGRVPQGDFYIVVTIKSSFAGSLTQIFFDDVILDEQYEFEPRDSDRIDLAAS